MRYGLDRIIWDKWSKNKTADIKPSGLDFVMDTMPFKARFKHSVLDEKPFVYEAEGKSISFKPIGMWWTTPQGKTTTRAVTPSVGSLIEGKVKYADALGSGIDIELSTERTRWRKEIIIKSLQSLSIPVNAEYLEISFEIETDFDIEGWDKKSELKFNTEIKLSELSKLEAIKTWDSHIILEDEDPFLRCDGFLRVVDGKYYLIKRIPADYLRDAVYPVTTDVEIAYGSEYPFNSATTTEISCTALDATHFAVVFKDVGDSSKGKGMIGVVTGDAIAYGSEYEFNAASTDNISVADLDSTHFAVVYRDNGGDTFGHAKIGVVTGDAIAFGSEYTFNAALTQRTSVAALDSTHFVVGYHDIGGDSFSHTKIGVVSSGDQIAYGSEYTFNAAGARYTSCARLDSTHFVVGYRDNGGDTFGHAKIGIVSSGDQIAYGSEYTFNSASTARISCAGLDATHFVVVYRDDGGDTFGHCKVGVVTGDAIAYGSEYTFNAASTQYYISCAKLDDAHFVVSFQDFGGDSYGIARIGVVTGDAIAYGSEYTFNAASTAYISCSGLDPTHFVVSFQDAGGDSYGIAMIGTYIPPVGWAGEFCGVAVAEFDGVTPNEIDGVA